MGLIEHYKGFQIWESDRHGKAVKGTKVTNSIQIRDYSKTSSDFYLLIKQISFKLGCYERRMKAIIKARAFIDESVSKNAL